MRWEIISIWGTTFSLSNKIKVVKVKVYGDNFVSSDTSIIIPQYALDSIKLVLAERNLLACDLVCCRNHKAKMLVKNISVSNVCCLLSTMSYILRGEIRASVDDRGCFHQMSCDLYIKK